jgi:N-methylhydantoinase A
MSDHRESRTHGYFARSRTVDLADLKRAIDALVRQVDEAISAKARTFPRVVECALAMRYRGQAHEVSVPIAPDFDGSQAAWDAVLARFHALHEERYAFSRPGAEVEVIGIEVDHLANRPLPELVPDGEDRADAEPASVRGIFVPEAGAFVSSPIYSAGEVGPGFKAAGPLIVEEPHTSVVVFPGQALSIDEHNAYTIEAVA